MPPALSYLEEDFRKELKKCFERGTFEINFYFKKSRLDIPLKQLRPWIRDYKKMAKDLGVAEDLTMSKVIHKATSETDYSLKPHEKKWILDIFRTVLKELQKRRLSEGRSLKAVLLKEISNLKRELFSVKAQMRKSKKEMHRGLQTKLKNLKSKEERESCLLYTSPSPRDQRGSRMPSSA